MAEPKHGGFDVYAIPFIPQAYRDVNEASVAIIETTPVRQIDFPGYVSAFAGSYFLTAHDSLAEPSGDSPWTASGGVNATITDRKSDDEGRSLTMYNYHVWFGRAMNQEANAQDLDCQKHALYKQPLRIPARRDPRPGMSTLHVPGLREAGSLRVEVGDVVQLRQLRFDMKGNPVFGSMAVGAFGWPSTPDVQHNGVVCGIDRSREELTLRIDWLQPATMLFNVAFFVQQSRIEALYKAITSVQKALLETSANWTRSQLLPDPEDGVMQTTLNNFQVGFALNDPTLNYEQKRAIDAVLAQQYGHIPYLISGPPGTGKTRTLVELTLQLLSTSQSVHLLVCAPSDPAADTLVMRLNKYLKPSELLRLNPPSRSFPEVPESILPFCYVDEDMFGLPPIQQMMKYRVVVVTCRDADILLQARLSNANLYELEVGLSQTLHPGKTAIRPQLHWTGLLCDEAAQATEPEVLIPLAVTMPPPDVESSNLPMPFFVLAGDQNQLGPRTASKLPVLQLSLFERLLDRPLYRDHILARSKQFGGVMRPLTQEMLPVLRPAFTNLIRNYRSSAAILSVPSSLFYFNTLEPQAINTDGLLDWEGWQGRGWPVLFANNTSQDEIEQDGGGWYNIQEAQMACRYAQSFLRAGIIDAKDICIMSPFRAQVKQLRTTARSAAYRMHDVNIGPLEAFQGLESRLVILCTTRTRNRFIEQDIAQGLGVIHEPRRFNVALTRAKEGLIVIGNAAVLEQDLNWAAFLSFCHRNGLCDPADQAPLQNPVDELGRLEKQLIHVEELEAEEFDDDGGDEALAARFGRALGLGQGNEDDKMMRDLLQAEQDLGNFEMDDQE